MNKQLQQIAKFEGRDPHSDSKPLGFELEAAEKAQAAIKALGDALNAMGADKAVRAGALVGLIRQHRYLQNETIVTLIRVLGDFGGLPTHQFTDPRNAGAHKLCQKMRAGLEDDSIWLWDK